MGLFTFVMEFRGGTYINQLEADTLEDAIEIWPNSLTVKEIKHFGETSRRALHKQLSEDGHTPVPLDGLKNCWCTYCLLPTGSALVNIVKTANN